MTTDGPKNTDNENDPRKPLTCPRCGKQNLTVMEKLYSYKSFNVKDNLLFNLNYGHPCYTGHFCISCDDCRQDDVEIEWEASEEEKKLIESIVDKATNPVDVTEFLQRKEIT